MTYMPTTQSAHMDDQERDAVTYHSHPDEGTFVCVAPDGTAHQLDVDGVKEWLDRLESEKRELMVVNDDVATLAAELEYFLEQAES